MDRKIIIYGMGDFSDSDELSSYIESDVFVRDKGRFDYAQTKNADLIILSLRGNAYGHFDIISKEKPTKKDRGKAIYIVKKPTTSYKNPVKLSLLGIKTTGMQFGRSVSEQQFEQIQALAGITPA